MKRIILGFIILLIFTNPSLKAQSKEILTEISNKLIVFKTYKTTCNFTITFPSGDSLSFESMINLEKKEKDTICGFYYNFLTNEKDREDFGDFSIYFNGYSYSSYNGVTEKVNNTSQTEINGIKIKTPAKRKILFDITPYEIAKSIDRYFSDTSLIVLQKTDTIIDKRTCLNFTIKDVQHTDKSVDVYTIDLCFDKAELYPIFYRKMANCILIYQACFTETFVNQCLPINYFSEENLLPKNWQKPIKVKKVSIPSDLVGKKAPDWILPILGQNKSLSLSDLKGKYIFLEFTATWCGVCNVASEGLNKVEEKFSNNSNIVFVKIFSSKRDNIKSISFFTDKYQINPFILYNAIDIEKRYHTDGYPTYFLISPKGVVLSIFGYCEGFEDYLTNSLNGYIK